MIKSIIFDLYNSIRTGLKLSVAFILVGMPVVVFTRFIFGVSVDEATAFIGIPLMLTYVVWRLARIFFAPSDRIGVGITIGSNRVDIVRIGIVVFGIPFMILGLVSTFLYRLLGMEWSVQCGRIITLTVGVCALLACASLIISFCDFRKLSIMYKKSAPILVVYALAIPQRLKKSFVPDGTPHSKVA
jgi:hypothetical protein